MQNIIEEFILQLHTKKDTSSNTEISYKRDLTKFFEYLNIGSIEEIKNIPGIKDAVFEKIKDKIGV